MGKCYNNIKIVEACIDGQCYSLEMIKLIQYLAPVLEDICIKVKLFEKALPGVGCNLRQLSVGPF